MDELITLRQADRILRDMAEQGGDLDLLHRIHLHLAEQIWSEIEERRRVA